MTTDQITDPPVSFFDSDITALVPWYGSNRLAADRPGDIIGPVDVCFIPFAGSLTEVPGIRARQVVCADLHEDLIRLAKIVRDPDTGPRLQAELRSAVFHQTELREAQERLRTARMQGGLFPAPGYTTEIARARDYFVACWMGRSSNAGTRDELAGNLSVRYTASGGGSAVRFQSAVDAISPAWGEALRRCEFVVQDFRVFIARVIETMNRQRMAIAGRLDSDPKSPDTVGLYCDPPFPGPGEKYLHTMSEAAQGDLSTLATTVGAIGARVVMRFYDHPLIRQLYPEPTWRWHTVDGERDQNNNEKPGVLIEYRHP